MKSVIMWGYITLIVIATGVLFETDRIAAAGYDIAKEYLQVRQTQNLIEFFKKAPPPAPIPAPPPMPEPDEPPLERL